MKVLRSTFVAAVAIFAAACGDKVTVAGPTAVTLTSTTTTTTVPAVAGKVNSVSVAPATATLTIGQQIKMTAAVNADAGIAATVTWTSSDATKASVVDVAGVVTVTAVAATPGVAICATSTVNTSVKGCGSVVVTAASATIPATATIAGVFGASITAPLDPADVKGRVNVQVNISTGTEVVSKVYLLLGTTVVDSQVYTSAQSAALRFAGENADAAKDVSQPTVLLGVNTAAYNTTTGAVSFANATGQALSVQLFVVGNTAARSTAKYSSTLTLNNTDAVYGSWTLPSTKVQAADAAGYQWTSLGGGTMTLNILPVLFSGKTATSATVKYTNFNGTTKIPCARLITAGQAGLCYSATAFGDTASTKTVTTFPGTASFTLYDRDMTRGDANANVITPPVPTISLIYSDNSTRPDSNLTALAGTSLALRVDNVAPADVGVAAPLRGSAKFYRSAASWTQRPGSTLTDADSSSLITSIGADNGVSNGPTFNGDLRGITWKVYAGAASTSTDSLPVSTTAITAATSLTEGSFHCIRVVTSDKLGNSTLYPDQTIKTAGTILATTCPVTGNQTRANTLDNTAPVGVWNTTGINYSSKDTAVATLPTGSNYFWSVTEANTVTAAATIQNNVYSSGVKVVSCILSTVAAGVCPTFSPTKVGTVYSMTSATSSLAANAALTANQLVMTVTLVDNAGNNGTSLTRVVVAANVAPTVTAPPVVLANVGADVTLSSFATDPVAVSYAAAAMKYAGASGGGAATSLLAGILPVDFTNSTSSLDAPLGTTYTKFLNVALSITVSAAPTYLFDLTDTQSALGVATFATYQPTWAVYAAGPGSKYQTAGAMTVTYGNLWVPGAAASSIAGITSGFDTPGSTSIMSAVTVPGATLQGGAALTATSGVFTTTITYYTYVSDKEAVANGSTYTVSKNVCRNERTTSLLVYDANGAAAVTPLSNTAPIYTPVATPAFTVDAYVKVGSSAVTPATNYLVRAGPATKIASSTTATTAAPCAGITTETWSYTLNPGLQRTLLQYPTAASAGQLQFMIKAAGGHYILGPAGAFTYAP